jgi:hypothetical protein
VGLARNHGLSEMQLSELAQVVKKQRDEILSEWNKHFVG